MQLQIAYICIQKGKQLTKEYKMRFENIELEIKRYMNHMSIESAVKKSKSITSE